MPTLKFKLNKTEKGLKININVPMWCVFQVRGRPEWNPWSNLGTSGLHGHEIFLFIIFSEWATIRSSMGCGKSYCTPCRLHTYLYFTAHIIQIMFCQETALPLTQFTKTWLKIENLKTLIFKAYMYVHCYHFLQFKEQ